MSLTKLSLGGNNIYMTSLFPPRESLVPVSDIRAGDGNIKKLFYGVYGRCRVLYIPFSGGYLMPLQSKLAFISYAPERYIYV
jgi:hypothetical protein